MKVKVMGQANAPGLGGHIKAFYGDKSSLPQVTAYPYINPKQTLKRVGVLGHQFQISIRLYIWQGTRFSNTRKSEH